MYQNKLLLIEELIRLSEEPGQRMDYNLRESEKNSPTCLLWRLSELDNRLEDNDSEDNRIGTHQGVRELSQIYPNQRGTLMHIIGKEYSFSP